jgi:ribonuclease HII
MRQPLTRYSNAAGADEAGRGTLAGPVVAAAVIIPDGFDISGLDDSKKLSPARRLVLEEAIKRECCWTVDVAHAEEVDRLNVLWASMAAIRRAVHRLSKAPDCVYIDGNCLPPELGFPCEAVIKGDSLVACIAAASILAKTARDRLMTEYAQEYPAYGFERHFGYSTPEHLAALREHGPSPIHRKTFAPVRDLLEQPCLTLDA